MEKCKATILLVLVFFVFNSNAKDYEDYKFFKQNELRILESIPTYKATVGTVLCKCFDGMPYIFLGRERLDKSHKSEAGTYSDLGGNVELDGTTYVDNLLRELNEESFGTISLFQADLYKNSILLYKLTKKHRTIFYVIYKTDDNLYAKTTSLQSQKLKNIRTIREHFLEKDDYVWVKLNDLLKNTNNIQEKKIVDIFDRITNINKKIQIRPYFLNDFLLHPYINEAENYIKTNWCR